MRNQSQTRREWVSYLLPKEGNSKLYVSHEKDKAAQRQLQETNDSSLFEHTFSVKSTNLPENSSLLEETNQGKGKEELLRIFEIRHSCRGKSSLQQVSEVSNFKENIKVAFRVKAISE